MEINPITKVNRQHEINKREMQEALSVKETIKTDTKTKGTHIKPYISVSLCDNLIMQNVFLKSCLETLAEDTIYNDVTITGTNNENNTDLKEFWENNQNELCKAVLDLYSYGFGACEIILGEDQQPAKLYEIQADTIYIRKEIINGEDYYYAIQQVNGVDNLKLRLYNHEQLTGYTYLEQDSDLPVCLWLGGGRKSDFFDYPIWISCFNHVSASVNLDMLDADKINNGNLISGILTIIRPPASPLEENVEDTLEDKMESKGSGLFTLELTTLNPNIPLTVDYIQISESNYDYLEKLASKCDAKILATMKIPKARLLIDDVTESMNSNKTNTLYKIYAIELNNRQRPLENIISYFNEVYFEFAGKTEIDTPVFVDDKDIETDITLKLFNTGLITLGQAIKRILKIFPEFAENYTLDEANPIYNERYYNGQPFGLTEPTEEETGLNALGDLVDYIQIG